MLLTVDTTEAVEAIAEALKIPPEEYNKYFFDHRATTTKKGQKTA